MASREVSVYHQCAAVKEDGTQCRGGAQKGGTLCGPHLVKSMVTPVKTTSHRGVPIGKQFKAKYDSLCPVCEMAVLVGESVIRITAGYSHSTCLGFPAPDAAVCLTA